MFFIQLAKRCFNIIPTEIPKISKYAKKYPDAIYFTMGEPDFTSPPCVKESTIQSIQNDNTYYTDDEGKEELRLAISHYYNDLYQLSLTASNIIVTNGATGGLYLSMMAVLEKDDEVIVFTPQYSIYSGQISSFGARPIFINIMDILNTQHLLLKLNQALSNKTKLILVNSPSNPTSKIINSEWVKVINDFACENNLFIISDEVYHSLVYDDAKFSSFCSHLSDNHKNTIIVDSFSKTFSMTGYRVGYIISVNNKILEALTEFSGWVVGSLPEFVQDGAIAALKNSEDFTEKMRLAYQDRRDQLINGINKISGLKCDLPNATFYAFIDIRNTGLSSNEFVYRLIDEHKIVVVPGTNYGPSGEGYVRVCFATSKENIDILLHRLDKFIKNLKR